MAAIRHVTTGTYLSLIREYESEAVKPELQSLKDRLIAMTAVYAEAVDKVGSVEDTAYGDFMARRLVEMAGNIIMGHLLVLDANRTDSFTRSAEVYCNIAQAEVTKHSEFIKNFAPAEIAAYKVD